MAAAIAVPFTASGSKAIRGRLVGVLLLGGSDAATVKLYDATSAVAAQLVYASSVAASVTHYIALPEGGVPLTVSLYAALTGTAPTAIAYVVSQ